MCRYSRSLPPRSVASTTSVKSLKLRWQELSPVASGERRSSWSFDTQPTSNSSSRSKNDLETKPASELADWRRDTKKNTTFFFSTETMSGDYRRSELFKTTSYSQYFIFTNLLPSILSKRLAFLPLLQTHQNQLLGVPNVWMSLEQW